MFMDKEKIKEILEVDIKVISDSCEEKVISLNAFVNQKDSYISIYKNDLENPKYKMDIHIEVNKYNVEVTRN